MKTAFLSGTNSRNAGGLFNSVKNLAFSLQEEIKIELVTFNDKHSSEDLVTYKDIPISTYKIAGPNNFGFSSNLSKILNISSPDIVHQQGIWMYHSLVACRYRRKNPQTKQIISPRGMLDPWAVRNSYWKKKIAGYLYENKNLRNADCLHALCESEYRAIRKFGLKNPVAIIPNGIHLPKAHLKRSKYEKNKKVLLYIGRIHPKKGLSHLIDALHLIEKKSNTLKDWEIRICGWSQNDHQTYLEKIVGEYNLSQKVKFIGPVFGAEKQKELLNADLFILPSHSEGLPMSVLEAWSYKLPSIITEECNLPEGYHCDAAVRIELDPSEMAKTLEFTLTLSDDRLKKIGENGYNLVKEKFTWERIGSQTIQLYEWLINDGEKPETVRVN